MFQLIGIDPCWLFSSPLDPSDSQTVDSPSLRNKPTSVSSAHILNDSTDRDEKVEDLDPDPSSSTTQLSTQPPPADSEPPAGTSQSEEGSSASPEHREEEEGCSPSVAGRKWACKGTVLLSSSLLLHVKDVHLLIVVCI